ncbi:type II toxin-antitoxin system HicB family antitoxin [Desulfoscipio geothermicus]|uniref:Antitoxin HicB n=1 Tax=Desulfoscipio geothermicus DSM 3669 TaxID=1121426 RepID=A0A1I6CXU2_9FIRM|nr:type II toxin-antitoxin system HicB family antitoxin [Desulfoscipio geothermicus]SFQ97897.1 antitoxin HicB [Desulfoscipio geothermicus DSM 3669]
MKKGLSYYLNLLYNIQLHPSPDGGYAVSIPELPGCISQGMTIEEALSNIEDAKKCWIESALEDGVEIPEPTKDTDYSGKLVVRMPKSLHSALARRAKEENVSLNQFINYQLARGIGFKK